MHCFGFVHIQNFAYNSAFAFGESEDTLRDFNEYNYKPTKMRSAQKVN